MNMPRFSLLWIYGVLAALILGYYLFGSSDDRPIESNWTTVQPMVERGDVEKILILNKDQAQIFLKRRRSRNTATILWTNGCAACPTWGPN